MDGPSGGPAAPTGLAPAFTHSHSPTPSPSPSHSASASLSGSGQKRKRSDDHASSLGFPANPNTAHVPHTFSNLHPTAHSHLSSISHESRDGPATSLDEEDDNGGMGGDESGLNRSQLDSMSAGDPDGREEYEEEEEDDDGNEDDGEQDDEDAEEDEDDAMRTFTAARLEGAGTPRPLATVKTEGLQTLSNVKTEPITESSKEATAEAHAVSTMVAPSSAAVAAGAVKDEPNNVAATEAIQTNGAYCSRAENFKREMLDERPHGEQPPSSSFGWFMSQTVDPGLKAAWSSYYGYDGASPSTQLPQQPVVDPDLQRALAAREEYLRSMHGLFGRYTPQQLVAYGLSQQTSPCWSQGGTPFVQSVPPATSPSTLSSYRSSPLPSHGPTPFASQGPTPFPSQGSTSVHSTFASPEHRRHQPTGGRRSSSGSAGRRSSQDNERRGRRSGGGSCRDACFGGGGSVSESPVRERAAPTGEDEDIDAPVPDSHGRYYRVKYHRDVDFGTAQGRAFRRHLQILIHSEYKNCFIKFKEQRPDHARYVEIALHSRFPNPPNKRFSTQWLEGYIKLFLRNKQSSVRRAAANQVANPDRSYRGGNMSDAEWECAMAEKTEEAATGSSHRQQREARARQHPTHYGSGGKGAWKDKYENITLSRPTREMVKYRERHTEFDTWRWLLENNHISREQFDAAVGTLQASQGDPSWVPTDEEEEVE